LLISVAELACTGLLAQLREAGVCAAEIGEVVAKQPTLIKVET